MSSLIFFDYSSQNGIYYFIFISMRVHIVFTLPDYYNYNIKNNSES